jgi:molybdenum cofactor biosynthesis protein B
MWGVRVHPERGQGDVFPNSMRPKDEGRYHLIDEDDSIQTHLHEHEADIEVSVGVVTVSTSRWKKYGDLAGIDKIPDDDESGKILAEELGGIDYRLVPDDKTAIASAVLDMLNRVDVVVTTGGTGISPKDVTIEAVKPMVEKELEGFGEIFRFLSYNEIGESAVITRAFAGILNGKAVFCLPGSKNAVRLGVRIIKPLLRHIISHARGLK